MPPTPAANVTVNVTSAAISASIAQGDPYSATVSGTWSATNLGSGAVYLQVSDSANTFTLPAIQVAPSNGAFSYALPASATLAAGERTGTITVKACKDATCSNAHAGTSGSVSYRLTVTVTPAPDWETVQGNAAHNGYVPVTLDASKFAKAWEWIAPGSGTSAYAYISPPVTGANGVYFRVGPYTPQNQQESIVALNESDGSLRWQKAPVSLPADQTFIQLATSPAYAAGKVYVGTDSGAFPNAVTAFDASTGGTVFSTAGIRSFELATVPTPRDGNVFLNERASGGLRAYVSVDGSNGSVLWRSASLREFEGAGSRFPKVVAVDDAFVYHYGKTGLHLLDKQTSAEVALIPPAAPPENGFDTPMVTLGGRGNALAYVYMFSQVSFQYEWYFASYNIASRALEWTTPLYYNGIPAVANGVIYATRADNNRVYLHALSEATGQLIWSWSAPQQDGQFVVGNVVVTKNLVFLSAGAPNHSSGTTWAIDLSTHQAAWSYPAAGEKAISSNRMLYIVHPGGEMISNEKKLTAIKLQ